MRAMTTFESVKGGCEAATVKLLNRSLGKTSCNTSRQRKPISFMKHMGTQKLALSYLPLVVRMAIPFSRTALM